MRKQAITVVLCTALLVLSMNVNSAVAAANGALAIEVAILNTETGEYVPEVFVRQTFGSVTIKATIENKSTESIQVIAFSTPPNCLSVVIGSVAITGADSIDIRSHPDDLFTRGLYLGEFGAKQKADIIFNLIIDDSKLQFGINSVPINVSARAVRYGEFNEDLEFIDCLVTGSGTINVNKNNMDVNVSLNEDDFPKLKRVAIIGGAVGAILGSLLTPLFDGTYGERLRVWIRKKWSKTGGDQDGT